MSTDPALGDYIPQAPVNEEAKKANGNLPGMGGVYNLVNMHLYHYAGNNPVRYTDPTGMFNWDETGQGGAITDGDTLSQIVKDYNGKNGTELSVDDVASLNGITDPGKIFAGNTLQFDDKQSQTSITSLVTEVLQPQNGANEQVYSQGLNIAIGIGEILLGGITVAGGTIAAAALAPETAGGSALVGYAGVKTGFTSIAVGITRLTGANNKNISYDVGMIFVPVITSVVDAVNQKEK